MLIVDSHCHAGESWFEPIEALVHQMDSNDVDKAVLVQHGGVYDNSYLLECAARYPGRFAVVAMVDTARPDAPARLEEWARRGAAGVRLAPSARSLGKDPLAVWRTASRLRLAVSSLGDLAGFASPEFRGLAAALSELTIVIEHLAGVGQAGEQPPYALFQKVLELATYPNVHIKVPGLGEISTRPPLLTREFRFDFTPPLVEMAREAFGPRRMMWGSDFPPSAGREGYGNTLRGVMRHPAFRSDDEREWVMGKTALRVFHRA
jgi:L-fuconolactonase